MRRDAGGAIRAVRRPGCPPGRRGRAVARGHRARRRQGAGGGRRRVERHGVKADGSQTAASADTLAELASLIAQGALEVPIAASYPLGRGRDAYAELAERHTRGKIVLVP